MLCGVLENQSWIVASVRKLLRMHWRNKESSLSLGVSPSNGNNLSLGARGRQMDSLIHSWWREGRGKEKYHLAEEQRCWELIPSHAAHPKRHRLQTMPVPSLDSWASQEVGPEQLQFVVWCFKAHWNSWLFILKFQAAKCRAVGASYEHLKSLCIRTEAGHFKSTW